MSGEQAWCVCVCGGWAGERGGMGRACVHDAGSEVGEDGHGKK